MSFPTVNHLLSAIAASLSAAVAALPIFIPDLNAMLNIGPYTWAPVWAMTIVELDTRTTISAATKTITAAWFGVGAGFLCYYLGTLVFETDLYQQHAIALVFMIPFTSLIRLSYPDTKTFPVHVLRWDVGLICAYTVAGFGKDVTTWTGTCIGLGFSVAAIVAVIVSIANRLLRPGACRPVRLLAAIVEFRITHSVWLEGLVDCMHDSTKHHGQELSRRQDEANSAFRELQSLIRLTRDDFVNTINDFSTLNDLYRVSSTINVTLIAIRGALSHDSMDDSSVTKIYTPEMKALVQESKLVMSTLLRPNGHMKSSRMSPIDLPPAIKIVSEDLSRFVFIITCLNNFQLSISDFVAIVTKYQSSEIYFIPRYKSIYNHLAHKLTNMRFQVPKSAWPFLIKGAITNEILAQVLVALQYQFSHYEISEYFGWAIVGYIVTFLPTSGEAIVRGSRRAIGTLVGSAFTAVIAVCGNINGMSAFFILVIVVFNGKLISYHPFVSNAGLVFALCQLFEILPQMAFENGTLKVPEGSVLLYIVLYRTICMCIGVGFSILCATLIYPFYSANRVRAIFSTSLKSITTLLDARFHERAAIAEKGLSDSNLFDLSSIFDKQKSLPEACAGAKSELFILSSRRANKVPFRLVHIINAESELYRLSNTLFIVLLIISYSKKSNESGIVYEQIRQLISEFSRCANKFANMIQSPTNDSALSRECVFDWSTKVSDIYTLIVDDMPLHNIVFALTEFLSAYDRLIRAVDPQLQFTNNRALTGIGSGQSVSL
jgi:hypothetical protein